LDFDLVVIGTGAAARAAARRVRKAGRTVAIIDEKPFGGTCPLRGCDPKKMLVSGVEVVDAQRRMYGHGVDGEVSINWPELIRFKRSFTDPFPEEQERRIREAGIAAFRGAARFTGSNSLRVGEEDLTGRNILIASGAQPVPLGIPGEEHLIDNEGFLALETLPRRIVLVGGGYIAAEFSHIAARAGAEVTVVQRGERMLDHFEPELVGWLMEAFDRIGVRALTNTAVTGIERTSVGFSVHGETDGRKIEIEADCVVHAAGRVPALEELDLEKGDIAIDDGRIRLNDFLQSVSNPKVYAAGDSAQTGPPLTPVAGSDGWLVAANLLEGNHRRPDYRGVPSVAFTLPPIAAVGMSEADVRASGRCFRLKCERTAGWYTARRVAEPVYGYKTLVEEGTDLILGAHIVGPHADEVVNLFGLAIRHDLTASDLKHAIFSYPTGASDIGAML